MDISSGSRTNNPELSAADICSSSKITTDGSYKPLQMTFSVVMLTPLTPKISRRTKKKNKESIQSLIKKRTKEGNDDFIKAKKRIISSVNQQSVLRVSHKGNTLGTECISMVSRVAFLVRWLASRVSFMGVGPIGAVFTRGDIGSHATARREPTDTTWVPRQRTLPLPRCHCNAEPCS
jgi:hypothetical protein